ncbi:MAG: hypothetical protein GY855_10485, partial [candidate division Zixibacteria bacterium]|nr:hypothetical protein [candidate division Zixibacteria bacterium]
NPETNTCPPGYFIRGIPDGYTTQVLISGTQVGYKFLPYIEDSLNLDWARETFPVWVGAVNQNDYYGGTPVFVEGFGGNPADVWINSETGFPVVADEYGIKQRITVGCNGSILIDGPLVYNGVGLVNVVPQTCVYSLGLISENWVWLSKGAPYNAYIHGGIIALDSCFSVHGVYDYTAPVRNSISLFGCVAQKNRGTVHRGNGGPPSETGYRQKDYSYDQRFTYRPPPYFITIGHSYTLFDIQEYWDLDYLSEIFDL